MEETAEALRGAWNLETQELEPVRSAQLKVLRVVSQNFGASVTAFFEGQESRSVTADRAETAVGALARKIIPFRAKKDWISRPDFELGKRIIEDASKNLLPFRVELSNLDGCAA